MGKSLQPKSSSHFEAGQTNHVSRVPPEDRSGSTGAVGQAQAGEKSGITRSPTAMPVIREDFGHSNSVESSSQIRISVFQVHVLIAMTKLALHTSIAAVFLLVLVHRALPQS